MEKESIGSSKNVFEGWQSRGTMPRVDDCMKIVTFLRTTIDYLMTGKFNSKGYPKRIKKFQINFAKYQKVTL
ncbi:MAG: hypothetical protein LKE40_04335 [Spirochaetia bacterium]|jgi:hypothetical protein|nr:hypothetical protein [Spirochaetia bacterium]